jgi:hypothetical protein
MRALAQPLGIRAAAFAAGVDGFFAGHASGWGLNINYCLGSVNCDSAQ